jgi:exodeoxyribonuclease V beta subunit
VNPGRRALKVFEASLDGLNLIEASAGTGKTWNICALYLRLLLERKREVQKILVVTFTNAATAELRERIRARIVEVLEALRGEAAHDPFVASLIAAVERNSGATKPEMRALLEAALSCFDEAAIYTIHGFCQRALADTPLAAGLPYGLELIEDDAELRHEAAADFWRREVAGKQNDPDLAAWLAVRYDSPASWADFLRRLQAKPLSRQIWPDDLDTPAEPLRAPLDAAFAAAKQLWGRERGRAVAAILAGVGKSLNRGSYTSERVEEGGFVWDAWFSAGDPLSPALKGDRRKRAALFSAEILAQRTLAGRTTPRDEFFDAAAELLACREDMEAQLERLRLRLLREMATEALAKLRDKKRARRVIGFDDILYNAWDALCNGTRPWLAAELRSRYPAALIDEFQDTDPLQCAIFMAIYGAQQAPGSLFLVGDPKQAIYSFRNADLHTYLQASERAQTACTLLSNQRSVEGLLHATNALFTTNPGGFILAGIGYQPVGLGDKKRAPFADRSGASAAPLRIWRIPADAEGQYPTRDDAHELAVRATAVEVSRLLRESAEGRITLDDRPLRGGDVAVLVRTHRQGRWIKEALAALGIGAVELSPESIFATRDAEDLERVLSAMLEPGRRPLLLVALATELMGLGAAEIEALSQHDASIAEWTSRFDELRATWLNRDFGVMFRRWIEQEGVSRRLLARADGERRMTNLLHLGEMLHRVAREQPAPGALLRWLATRRAEAATGEEAQVRLESDRNLVQIVTIHKAKGLEYGIVFCPFAWDGFLMASRESYAVEYHDDSGNGVMDFRPEAVKQQREVRRQEQAEERVRLIYVALTRAVHRCYLVAGCYAYGKRAGRGSTSQSTDSVLNWLASRTKLAYAQWIDHDRKPAEIEQAWQRIADEGAPHILLEDLPAARGANLSGARREREDLSALAAPKRIDPGWRIGSFSALASGAAQESAASDHDARIIRPVESAPPEELAAHDILRFPRGPSAGDCVHAAFERADFTDPSSWDSAIRRALTLHPQGSSDAARRLADLHGQMLRGMLEAVVSTALPGGVVLGKVPAARRLDELGFHLSAAHLSAARLNAWLRSNGFPTPRLSFETLQGYLSGFIDLTFESGGRFYVLDWKSNHLGYAPGEYGAEQIAGAMREHGYYLQALLYCVAIHRYLARRIPQYSYERHFGGLLYLFVRGVRPRWIDEKGAQTGVWFHRPDAATLASLDALLAGRDTKAAA